MKLKILIRKFKLSNTYNGRQLRTVKMVILSKLMYTFNAIIPTRIPISFFAENDKLIPKFVWNFKRPKRAKTVFKKNKVGGLIHHNFKT